ncbi:hypothetical protein [Micromonospora sp. NPDC000668]|uniref:hypothetical protein n=1 Tax=Micromonospora sp. NPDC000668 TaxID=3364219 RepID=UPI0036A89F92
MSESAQQREPDQDLDRPDRVDDGGDPDILLDIPRVTVESIRLAVNGLDADLSLRARLANLLEIDAGVRVHLHSVELDINGVQAEAQLRVRLEQLATILGRALDTIDSNPQIIETLGRTAGIAINDVNRSAQQLAAGAVEATGSAQRPGDVPGELGRRVGTASPVADRLRPGAGGPGPGAGGPEPRVGGPGPGVGGPGPVAGGPGPRVGGPGPGAGGPRVGGPGPGAGGPGAGEQERPKPAATEGRRPEAQGPESQRQPDGGQDGGGVSGGAYAAAQSAAQLAEQAGETLRQAGRSVWEAIQGGVAQHRQQGRRDQ